MTQLNLSGKQSNPAPQKSVSEPEDESIKNQTVGALGALAMFAAVIVIGSCSRSSKPVAVQQPVQPAAPVSVPAAATAAPAAIPAPVVAKTKKHRAATLSYVNREYGVSFRFPRTYALKTQLRTGDDATLTSTAESLPMNFVHAGGMPLAAVELPGNAYPGTNFKSGFVKVSVNPGMTSEACGQFTLPASGTGTETTPAPTIGEVKLGTIDFHEVENAGGAMTKQTDTKYYHAFANGACYEFALGVDTGGDTNVEEITPVDRTAVFAKMEKILATVKLQPAVLPETRMLETGMTGTKMTGTSTTEGKTNGTTTPATQATETKPAAPAVAATTPAESSVTPANTSVQPEQHAGHDQEKGAPVPNF